MTEYVVPLLLLTVCAFALGKKEDPYSLMLAGAADGLKLVMQLVPTLVLLMTAVTMLRQSGAIEILSQFFAPVFSFFGIPPETAILVLIRPISGSAAAIMLGSTETTFYTVSVYFGAAGIRRTRYTVPAALIADLTGFAVAALTARLLPA